MTDLIGSRFRINLVIETEFRPENYPTIQIACKITQKKDQIELHEFLLQTGSLAGAVAQEIEVRTADT